MADQKLFGGGYDDRDQDFFTNQYPNIDYPFIPNKQVSPGGRFTLVEPQARGSWFTGGSD